MQYTKGLCKCVSILLLVGLPTADAQQVTKPNIVIIATVGTIAGVDKLNAAVRETKEFAAVRGEQIFQIG
ncbi:hypothetical protein [Pseudomonas sp. M30-35]|uniref:hypothetical protein n=1 Tax=Pseudomonas sp. M30-35 TaxID=1981174 RepID=UPI000B3C464E|nr:hypothetical protein [Pseudomonas sp. M30-35]ARU89885.1 hypothetical protein B9K09_18755 [Pseudomonas sp. M30-35]